MFGLENLDGWKLVVLALIGIFVIGPDRLPKAIAEGVRMLRNLRNMARNATADLSRELGTDIQLQDLHPKAFIRKHLLSEEDEQATHRDSSLSGANPRIVVAGRGRDIRRDAEPRSVQSRAWPGTG